MASPSAAIGSKIEPALRCSICDVNSPINDSSLKRVIISLVGGEVILDEPSLSLSQCQTVEWVTEVELKPKWRVEFLNDPFEPHVFQAEQCGFKVTNLPAADYPYVARFEGIDAIANGVISVVKP